MTNAPRHLQSTYKVEQYSSRSFYALPDNVLVNHVLGRGETAAEAKADLIRRARFEGYALELIETDEE